MASAWASSASVSVSASPRFVLWKLQRRRYRWAPEAAEVAAMAEVEILAIAVGLFFCAFS